MKKLLLLLISVFAINCVNAKPKAIIISGQNNHNWKVSHLMLKDILDKTGKFKTVDIALTPEKGGDMTNFDPDFSAYDVVILDYNGDRWTKKTDDAFLKYVQSGGGVVIYHAADNAFADWEEFNKIIALGGWEGRTEKSGPYVYLEDGKLVKDMTPGPGGSHGSQHEYKLNLHNTSHPVLKGIPQGAIHAQDELYDHMRGPGNIKELLVTSYADPATGGSGHEEPLVFTVDYHDAPIVHIMLGHAGTTPEESPALNCQYFQQILINGALFAAGK